VSECDGQMTGKVAASTMLLLYSRAGKPAWLFHFHLNTLFPDYVPRITLLASSFQTIAPPHAHLTSSLLLRRLDPLVLRWQAHLKWFNMNLTTFICCSEWQVAYNKTECRPNAVRAGQQGSTTNTNSCPRLTTITFKKILKFLLCLK